jgi:hypothetical protein
MELDMNRVVYLGYTRQQLEDAFNRVKNEKHWKYPICKTITIQDEAELAVIDAAVVFYAGCHCTFTRLPGAGANEVHVQADGYFIAVGS